MAKLTERQMLLVQLAEEAGEIVLTVSKCLRFGEDTVFDDGRGEQSNIDYLEGEMHDMLAMIKLVRNNRPVCEILIKDKIKAVEKYMEKSRELGTLKVKRG